VTAGFSYFLVFQLKTTFKSFFSDMRRNHHIILQMWEGDCCPTCSYEWCLVEKMLNTKNVPHGETTLWKL